MILCQVIESLHTERGAHAYLAYPHPNKPKLTPRQTNHVRPPIIVRTYHSHTGQVHTRHVRLMTPENTKGHDKARYKRVQSETHFRETDEA